MNWLGLKERVAVVTGGASGIGRACCIGLAEVGVFVVVADINEEGGRETIEELKKKYGSKHLFVRVDVTDRHSVENLIETTVSSYGQIDIFINNAGINIPRLLVDPEGKEELTEDVWNKVVSINLKGTYLCAQIAARRMIKSSSGGVIINMASEAGTEGSEGQSVYAATKAAIYALNRSWAKELGKHNIRIVGVAPGILEPTPLRSKEYERALAYTRGITVEQLRATYKTISIPLGRSGRLSEVADVVCFLASDRASYIHGTVINVSGGKSRA
ncbi:MAG: SDR family oxidoreductase [Spirochaetota bacterium]|nr:MAG: SDR family oxidoreductase [Spirochaetota bacterium]